MMFWYRQKIRFTGSQQGLTFIEMLVTVALVSLLSLVLYTSLINGMKVWKRSQGLITEEDIVIFFDKLSSDLRNTFWYEGFSFEGDRESLAFPAFVDVIADSQSQFSQGEYIEQLGQVKYFFDPQGGCVYKQIANYSQARDAVFPRKQKLVCNISQMRFTYYFREDQKEVARSDISGTVPLAVEVELTFQDKKIRQRKQIKRFIHLPLGQ